MNWYVLNKLMMATLCNSEEDAIASAKEYDVAYPKVAPHVATLMMPVGKDWTSENLALHQLWINKPGTQKEWRK